jgi:hypothetical protein
MSDAHLTDARLAELGQGRAGTPVNGERAHLGSCAACAGRLADERRLSALLARIPNEPPAASFAAAAKERYERENRATAVRRVVLVLCGLAVSVGAWFLVAWVTSDAIAIDLAGTLASGAAVFRVLGDLVAASPLGFAVCIALVSTALIAACGALAVLIRGSVNARASSEARVKEV